jgi:drug/metabolite transporter (DMT)-like permease
VKPADVARLLALAAVWGASFVFIRVLAQPLGPIWTAATRVLIAGVALLAWQALRGERADLATRWRAYLFVGVVNSSMPFVLYALAARVLPASYMVILNATTPLFTALLASAWLGERLTRAHVAAFVAGIAGVALVSGAGGLDVDASVLLAVAACLLATLCYAWSAVWLRRRGAGVSPYAVATWSQLFAGLVLLPLGAAVPAPGPWSSTVVANMLALALLCSALAYRLYYRLIQDIGPTRTMTVTFLMPAFGIAWGALFLDEAITLAMIAGAALIVGGTATLLRPVSKR